MAENAMAETACAEVTQDGSPEAVTRAMRLATILSPLYGILTSSA